MSKFLVCVSFFLLLTGFSCSSGTPYDPHWHKESCAHCRMVLSEQRYAVQLVGPGNRVRFYDDLICAFKHRTQQPDLHSGRLYVRPYGQEGWVPAEEATYVSGLQTPMNSGIGPVTTGGNMRFREVEELLNRQSQSSQR